jgi:CBS domain-containing protein
VDEAARAMRDKDIGDVVVTDGPAQAGVVTDRDIVGRAVADRLTIHYRT